MNLQWFDGKALLVLIFAWAALFCYVRMRLYQNAFNNAIEKTNELQNKLMTMQQTNAWERRR